MNLPKISKRRIFVLVAVISVIAVAVALWHVSAKVTNGALSEDSIQYSVLTNLRPKLWCDSNTTAFSVRAKNQRTAGGHVLTTIWSQKALCSLNINWSRGSVSRAFPSDTIAPCFAETDQDSRTSGEASVGFGTIPPEHLKPVIVISKFDRDGKESYSMVPYDHRACMGVVGYISNNYPIAAIPKISESTKQLFAILILDVPNGKLLGELTLPPEAKTGRPDFILDQQNDVLLIAQFGLDWLVAVDLRPYVQKIRNSKGK